MCNWHQRLHCGVGLALLGAVLLTATIGDAAPAKNSPEPEKLQPLMAQTDKILLNDDFSQVKPVGKGTFQAGQGTQWKIVDGVLRGVQSTPEYQASRKDHKGVEPRIQFSVGGQEYVVDIVFRVIGGKPSAVLPFLEFGHHTARLMWPGAPARLVCNGESVLLAEVPEFKLEDSKWYHALCEVKGDEVVIQFENGPTIYGKHPSLAEKKERPYMGFCGAAGGTAEVDSITIWSVKPENQSSWTTTKAKLPASKDVEINSKKKAK